MSLGDEALWKSEQGGAGQGRFEPPPGLGPPAEDRPARPRRVPMGDAANRTPRQVPLLVRAGNLAGGFANQFGWSFFGFGMVFVWVFLPAVDVTSWYRFRGPLETASGTVTAVEKAGMTENDVEVCRVRYAFAAPGGARHEGVSYVRGERFRPEERVTIQYRAGEPSVSRIRGARSAPLPIWAALVLVFPGVGLVFIAAGLRRGLRANRLLRDGKLGYGVLVAKAATSTSINNRPVYKLTFEFVAEDGRTYRAACKTHQTELVTDEAEERLFYDLLRPDDAIPLDLVATGIEMDDLGSVRPRRPVRAAAALIIPGLSILGHGLWAVLRYL
jgi:hypothetical protein